jgi:transposase-like protein
MNTKGHCYPESIILQAVYFKLRFTLSYRDGEEIMIIRRVMLIMLLFSAGFISLHLSLSQG